MTITKRTDKGSALTFAEMDENIRDLREDTDLTRVLTNGSNTTLDLSTTGTITADTFIGTLISANSASEIDINTINAANGSINELFSTEIDTTILRTTDLTSTNLSANTLNVNTINYVDRNFQPGEVIEEFSGICDGQSFTVRSGTYTLQNVTVAQNLINTGRSDVTGSLITYTPPAGTSRVYYSLEFAWDNQERSGISNYIIHHSNDAFVSDDNVVIDSGRNMSVNYISGISVHAGLPVKIQHTFVCNAGTESLTDGKFTSWTTPKTIKITAAEHSGSYEATLHQLPYFNNPPTGYTTGQLQFVRPHLTIRAIA